jgi:hypothetical protein
MYNQHIQPLGLPITSQALPAMQSRSATGIAWGLLIWNPQLQAVTDPQDFSAAQNWHRF